MGNRREEERNEKIIRGLMKLPPNRRCINCNSLGPQYVCTNFWTFVCTTCSGIHREFTHRVKSVSMAKFTSQEVEALQIGGNQRARELFLKDWDLVGMRLPDSSNVDKVRTFIKNVYVDRKYTGVKTADKPPRDLQSLRNYEDQVRRASSYHSYSQSPPYDNQYEDRRYGKQTPVLTRKPGSDRGMYGGKVSSFLYSPGQLSDQTFEDRFANEGSVSRTSDYSTSSGGDQFRSVTQSPSFDETGFNSPCSAPPCRETTERRTVGAPLSQKTLSVNSSGSFHINPVLLNSGNLKDVVSRPQQSAVLNCNTKFSFCSVPPSSISGNSGGLNLFDAPFASESVSSSASTIDLFQPPATSSDQSVHLFQSSPVSSAPSMPLHIPSQITPELSAPKNDGWATFDVAQSTASSLGNDFISHKTGPTCGHSLINVQSSSPSNTSMQQSSSGNSNATTFASLNPWQTGLQRFQDSTGTNLEHPWNAFEDSISQHSIGSNQHNTDSWAAVKPSFVSDPDCIKVVHQGDVADGVPSASQAASQFTGPSYTHSDPFSVVGSRSHASELKSTNPFDMPYDSVDPSDSLDVSSLQSALPPSFLEGVSEAWFPQHQATTCIAATPQGGLGYIAGAAPVSQLPGASIGGRNPFA